MSNVRISSIRFVNFKALRAYSVSLAETNILVGPNNSGKSTIISAFRILDVALRKARRLRPERVPLPGGNFGLGHRVPEQLISVSLENVATDYNSQDSEIEFTLTNRNKLFLFFPADGGCILHWESIGPSVRTPGKFKVAFSVEIQVIPVLGPLEHEETYVNEETVKNSLATHRACRHFRNYWYYFGQGWEEFADMIASTWPGMVIKKPELDIPNRKLSMFVSEDRIDREIYWAGFGFQIWCQLLTHLSRSRTASIIVIDEPEIYLHPDVQRQLLNILRSNSADVLLATHSVEIMGEADPSEILLVTKGTRSAKRLKDVAGVQLALESLGSSQNVTLTHLARTKKILFVEGMDDYKRIRRFAKKLGRDELAAGNQVTAFESGGFSSWEKIRSFAWGLKNTINASISIFAVYDRDYYCSEEIEATLASLRAELTFAHVHQRKEMENYLLVIPVLERALLQQIEARNRRSGETQAIVKTVRGYLEEISDDLRQDAQAQYMAKRTAFHGGRSIDASTLNREAIREFETAWADLDSRMEIVPGKATLRRLRDAIQAHYKINLTDVKIIDAFERVEVPEDLRRLVEQLEKFRAGAYYEL